MNTEQTSENTLTCIKTHYDEPKIQKLEKTMINYSSYTNNLRFFYLCHNNKILSKNLPLKIRIKTKWSKAILQHPVKLLLKEQIHFNLVMCDRLKNSIKQLKFKILESIMPDEFHSKKYFHLAKKETYRNLMNLSLRTK